MALIKCKECGKKISDMATACIYCGCPISKIIDDKKCEENQKILNDNDTKYAKNLTNTSKEYIAYKPIDNNTNKKENKKSKEKFWICIIIVIFFFLIIKKLSFSNTIALIFSAIYFLILAILYYYIIDNIKKQTTKKTITIMCSVFIPIIISILLLLTNTEWSYNNIEYAIATDNDTEFYHLYTNIFGKCKYSYHNLNQDIKKETSSCKYEKDNETYTFYFLEKDTDEESSFDCFIANGKLKCPLQYTYPTKYIYFKKK